MHQIIKLLAWKPVVAIIFFLLPSFSSGFAQTRSVYKIQVASHLNEYPVDRIQRDLGISQAITMHFLGGRYKYFVGEYDSRSEAEANLSTVNVEGAWVVKVDVPGSQVVDAQPEDVVQAPLDTVSAEQEVADTPGISEEVTIEMVFRIQVAAERNFIDPERVREQKGLSAYDLDFHFINGWYKYFTGDFATREEAEQFLLVNKIEGFVTQAPIERRSVSVVSAETTDTVQSESGDSLPADDVELSESWKVLQDQYQRLIDQGDLAFTRGDYDAAAVYYRQASELDPSRIYPRERLDVINKLSTSGQTKISKQLRLFGFAIAFFVLILIMVLVFNLILRTRRKNQEARTEILRDGIQDSVTEYLFDEGAAEAGVVNKLRSTRDKQVLIDEIMQLYSNLSGEISNRLRELYIDLGLDNESVQKTQSPQWHVRAKGFRELAQMNIKTVNHEIERCLNSDNDVLRMEAQLAMIRLNYENPFDFLDKLEKPFTSWEQLHVYEMITRHQITVPDFYHWLNSKNESIIMFCLRMIRAFKQTENYTRLYPFLEHQNSEIREEAIVTLGDLQIIATLPVLRSRYIEEDQDGKVLILQAMSKMPEEDNIDFLQAILEPSNALRLEAAEALSRIESFGVKGIETILRRSDDDLQAVARHILDSKIR